MIFRVIPSVVARPQSGRAAESRDLAFGGRWQCLAITVSTFTSCRARPGGALYIGMTNDLRKRVWQHRNHSSEGFTDDYNATRLVYWESFEDVKNAIEREKQLKGWRREKKLWLIEKLNPGWKDLAAGWYVVAAAVPKPA